MTIDRYYSDLNEYCIPGRALILFGARQTGKTTLLERFLKNCPYRYKLDSGDNLMIRNYFAEADFDAIANYVEGYDLIALDEAQNIPRIGESLKIITDQHKHLRVIATGSSSFELAGQVGEPLTGRKKTITLYPVADLELLEMHNAMELRQQLEQRLIYGSYPRVVTAKTISEKKEYLNELASSYLFKDILVLDKVKNPKKIVDLLRLLAFQVGNEVSMNELGQKLSLDAKSVKRYIDLLEKTFIIYSLSGFSKNLRNEITKTKKYYFYDNGVRNAIVANFNALDMRDDIGALWENYLVIERVKKQSYLEAFSNNYFWRTWEKSEIDWIEERDGSLFAYEFKYKQKKVKMPGQWKAAYPEAKFTVINSENFVSFTTEPGDT